MNAPQHAAPAPVGGSLFNATTLVCGVLMAVMATIIVVRLFFGLASTTNVNDGYSWGLWVVVDVFIGSALACGGFCMALLVYIFNKGKYHPLVRPALLGSLFGYTWPVLRSPSISVAGGTSGISSGRATSTSTR